jgi:hypothetical protein
MRYILTVAMILVSLGYQGQAWANACYSKAVSFKTIPHERPSTITLEASQVKSVKGNDLTYDLGKETIVIQADSFAAKRFLADVDKGRCSARETVTLQPDRKSPFNTRFKAVRPPSH